MNDQAYIRRKIEINTWLMKWVGVPTMCLGTLLLISETVKLGRPNTSSIVLLAFNIGTYLLTGWINKKYEQLLVVLDKRGRLPYGDHSGFDNPDE